MAVLLAALALLAPPPASSGGGETLAFVHTFRGPGVRTETIGRSATGRRIELRQLGAPRWPGELLVFGCIHGDECAASAIEPVSGSLTAGCPDPSSDIYFVPNLDPDGAAAGIPAERPRRRPQPQLQRTVGAARPARRPRILRSAAVLRAGNEARRADSSALSNRQRRSGSTSTAASVPSCAPGARACRAPATLPLSRGCRSARCDGRPGRRRTGRTAISRRRPSSSSCRGDDWSERCGPG